MPSFFRNVREVLALAVPVVLGELGWMMMTTVDTIMVGRLGPASIGAIGIGSSAFYSFAVFGMGLLLGLDTLVSQSCGAGDREDCHKSLTQGFFLAVALTVPLMVLFTLMPPLFRTLGIIEPISSLAGSFIRMLNLSTLPLLLYAAFRRYLQGMGHVRPVMFVLISANLINWLFNWLLIKGNWGFPAQGVTGSALSTVLARIYMAAALATFIYWFERGEQPGFRNLIQRPDQDRLKRLLQLGVPAATQILLEVAAFGTAAVFAGRLTPIALAAHQVAINCASLTFMVPLGIASAAAVAVGHAVGRREPHQARRNGFIAIMLGCVFMLCAALAFVLIPRPILRIYSLDPELLRTGTGLLAIAAFFQLFDGIQTISTGALRGLGETRGPMVVNLIGYWLFGLPIGYALCFYLGRGIYGLWWGLTLALVAISLSVLWLWHRKSSRLIEVVPDLTTRTYLQLPPEERL
jgi:MATE family multidrug resistance protein